MAIVSIDLSTCPSYGVNFDRARDKIRELMNYASHMQRIQVFPDDYKQLVGAVDRKFKKTAREQTKSLREQRKRDGFKGKVDPVEPDTVGDIHWGGVPVQVGVRQSKPRRFEP